MKTIQLDVSHEASQEEVIEFASEFECTANMIIEFGPGGGNPVYEFTGTEDNINRLMEAY